MRLCDIRSNYYELISWTSFRYIDRFLLIDLMLFTHEDNCFWIIYPRSYIKAFLLKTKYFTKTAGKSVSCLRVITFLKAKLKHILLLKCQTFNMKKLSLVGMQLEILLIYFQVVASLLTKASSLYWHYVPTVLHWQRQFELLIANFRTISSSQSDVAIFILLSYDVRNVVMKTWHVFWARWMIRGFGNKG